MSRVLARLRTLLPFEKRHALSSEFIKQPFYESTPSWWMKYSWAMAGGGLFMGFTIAELTWREWSYRIDPTDTEAGKEKWVLRPAWQRGTLAALHAGFGVGLVALVIGARSRYVRRLHIIPANVSPQHGGPHKRLFVQSIMDGKGGTIFPFHHTRLYPGRDETEVILRVDGKNSHWWIGTKGAKISGESMPAERARERLMALWGLKKGDDSIKGRGLASLNPRVPTKPAGSVPRGQAA